MNDQFVVYILELINILNLLILALLILAAGLLWFCNTKSNQRIYKTFFYYFFINVVLKLTSDVFFYFQPNEGITEFPYFSLILNILNYSFFYYFICYELKISKKLIYYIQVLSLVLYILFFYEIYKSSFTNMYSRVSYSPGFSKVIICIMLLMYLIETINRKTKNENPFFLLALILFGYHAIEITYEASSNYIINHIEGNDHIFLFMFSDIFLEFIYVLLLVLFIFKRLVYHPLKKVTV